MSCKNKRSVIWVLSIGVFPVVLVALLMGRILPHTCLLSRNQCLHALLAPGVRNLDSAVDWLTQQPEEVVMFPPIVPRAAEAKASATTDSSAAVTESTPMSARAQPTEVITETGSVVAAASTDSATTTVTVGTADSTATAAAKQEETEDEEAKEIYKQAIKSPLSFHYKMILGVRMDTAMEKVRSA